MVTDAFWTLAVGRLEAQERSLSWLARKIGVTRSAISNYAHGYRNTPLRVRRDVALLLDIRTEKAAA